MWTKLGIAVTLVSLCAPGLATAQGFKMGDKEFLLSGSGTSDKKFKESAYSISGALGYFLTDGLEVAFRQDYAYANPGDVRNWAATSRIAGDFNFNFDWLVPFVGASVGYMYGDNVRDTWVAGPEGGLKGFVNDTTFIIGSIAYDFFFKHTNQVDTSFDKGRWVYMVGIGFRW
jgi:hypothetical protein